MTPEQIEAARTMPQERVDAARPFILAALRGGGSVDDCIRAALAAADAASPAATTIAALRAEVERLRGAPDTETDKPPMPAHDYARQWASDTTTGRADGGRFPWGERNLARCYLQLRADLAAKSDALTIISKHDLVDFENPIEPGDAYRVLNNAILLARAALKEPPHAQ